MNEPVDLDAYAPPHSKLGLILARAAKEPEAPIAQSETEGASKALREYARNHIAPTIAALKELRNFIDEYTKELQRELQHLEDESENFALHNHEAQHCFGVCADAVQQLMKKRKDNGKSS